MTYLTSKGMERKVSCAVSSFLTVPKYMLLFLGNITKQNYQTSNIVMDRMLSGCALSWLSASENMLLF